MLLCIVGVIGLWGIGFFAPELVGDVISQSLRAKGVAENEVASQATYYRQGLTTSYPEYRFLLWDARLLLHGEEKSW